MPDTDDYDDDDSNDTGSQQQAPGWRRKLEADAKAGREAMVAAEMAKAEAEDAKRQLALMQLGVDMSSGPGKLFAKAYDGPIDVDAMRTAAEEYGVLAPPQQVNNDQQQALQRIQQAAAGGMPGGGAAYDFEAELDRIPQVVDGQWNPDYTAQVLAATQIQAAREGRDFVISGGQIKPQKGYTAGPATAPLR